MRCKLVVEQMDAIIHISCIVPGNMQFLPTIGENTIAANIFGEAMAIGVREVITDHYLANHLLHCNGILLSKVISTYIESRLKLQDELK